mgnify:CR=1 FL=1
MITEHHLKIFEVFAKNPYAEHTRKEIKKEAREKSNNTLALVINRLKKEDVLRERIIGRSGILTLNLKNDLTYTYIMFCNNNILHSGAKLSFQRIQEELKDVTPFYSLVIFGSYAKREQKKTSDLDVAIFFDDEQQRKNIIASINTAKLKSPLEMDVHVITKKEMIEMLTNKEENLGKQIARKHLTVQNHQIFYDIIQEGMNHGFHP